MRTKGAAALAGLGRTQLDLAARLNVSSGIVAMWFSGQRTPGLPNRKLMFRQFGIPIESWDQEIPPEPPGGWGETAVSSRLERLERIVDRDLADLEGSLDEAPTMLDRSRRAIVVNNLTSAIDRIRRLKGEDAPEVNVLRHPKWAYIRSHILAKLEGHPLALAEVLDGLEELEEVPGNENGSQALSSARSRLGCPGA